MAEKHAPLQDASRSLRHEQSAQAASIGIMLKHGKRVVTCIAQCGGCWTVGRFDLCCAWESAGILVILGPVRPGLANARR